MFEYLAHIYHYSKYSYILEISSVLPNSCIEGYLMKKNHHEAKKTVGITLITNIAPVSLLLRQ